jgi:hypothetical protein
LPSTDRRCVDQAPRCDEYQWNHDNVFTTCSEIEDRFSIERVLQGQYADLQVNKVEKTFGIATDGD